MNKKIYIVAATLLTLQACDYNDKYFDDLDNLVDESQKVITSVEYTLTDADYATIGQYKDKAIDAEDTIELKGLAKAKAFTLSATAQKYIPMFLANKYTTVDNQSAVKVTYNQNKNVPEYLGKIAGATNYTLTDDDYATIWGSSDAVSYLTPSTVSKLKNVLANVVNPVDGDYALISYAYSETEPATEAAEETYSTIADVIAADNGEYTVKGTICATYGQGFLINDATGYILVYLGEAISYTIGDVVTVTGTTSVYSNMKQFGKGSVVTFVEKNSSFAQPSSTYQMTGSESTEELTSVKYVTLTGVLTISDNKYYIAYGDGSYTANIQYPNDGIFTEEQNGTEVTIVGYLTGYYKTSTYFIAVSASNKSLKATASTETKYALYKYNGTSWAAVTSGVVVLNPSDYTAMGLRYANFSATDNANVYIPKFLATNKPYALEDDVVAVVYNYYDATTKETSLSVDEYNFINGVWSKTTISEAVTSQFVKTNNAFVFDPSVVINLPKESTSGYFYQASTDWVWENIDTPLGFTKKGQGYVTSYANNEYYTGSTAYQNNVDWRVDKAREQYAAGYEGLSNDEALALMQNHLKEAWAGTLSVLYPDAKPIEGIDITYTINFIVYGIEQTNWTVAFKLVGVGQFEYVEESLKAVE